MGHFMGIGSYEVIIAGVRIFGKCKEYQEDRPASHGHDLIRRFTKYIIDEIGQ